MKYTKSSWAMATFSVAVGKKWTDKNTGEKQEHTEWFNCVSYGNPAKWLQRGKKGGLIFVEGRFRSNDTTKADGSPIRYTNLIADRAFLIATLPRDESAPPGAKASGAPDMDDDIPF